MAWSNRSLNRLALQRLNVRPGDSVLEIGFGPGEAIALLVSHTNAGWIAGIDPSAEMLEQAVARNAPAVESGRVDLRKATVEKIPHAANSFDKTFAVSNFMIWSPARGLAEIHRVLKPGGMLVICQRAAPKVPRWWKSPGLTKHEIARARALMQATGFRNVLLTRSSMVRRQVCLTGEK
jgi:ubiquinone/menaquinone biosynthesis C-methylase UbiE